MTFVCNMPLIFAFSPRDATQRISSDTWFAVLKATRPAAAWITAAGPVLLALDVLRRRFRRLLAFRLGVARGGPFQGPYPLPCRGKLDGLPLNLGFQVFPERLDSFAHLPIHVHC